MPESWRDLAACKGKYGQADRTFDHPVGAEAKQFVTDFCGSCTVRSECFAFAESVEEGAASRWGAYGGLMGAERDGLVRWGYRRCPDCLAVFIPTQREHRRCSPCRQGRTTVTAGPVSEHGTRAGYDQHRRRNEEPCWGCSQAKARYSKWCRARQRGAA